MVRLSKEGHFVAAAGTSLGGCGAIETASKQTETEKVDIPNWRTATRSENRVAPAKRSRGPAAILATQLSPVGGTVLLARDVEIRSRQLQAR